MRRKEQRGAGLDTTRETPCSAAVPGSNSGGHDHSERLAPLRQKETKNVIPKDRSRMSMMTDHFKAGI